MIKNNYSVEETYTKDM